MARLMQEPGRDQPTFCVDGLFGCKWGSGKIHGVGERIRLGSKAIVKDAKQWRSFNS